MPKLGKKPKRARKDLAAKVDRLDAQVMVLTPKLKEIDIRFSSISEKIGEIRGMVLAQERESAELKKRTEKAIRMVEETHPESPYAELKKRETEMGILRDRLSSTDEMLHTVMNDLKDMRRTILEFKGIEGLRKLSKEVRTELIAVQKTKGVTEKYADKVATIFIEVQRRFRDIARLAVKVDSQNESIRSLSKGLSSLEVKLNEMATKAELGESLEDVNKIGKQIEDLRTQMKSMNQKVKSLPKLIARDVEKLRRRMWESKIKSK